MTVVKRILHLILLVGLSNAPVLCARLPAPVPLRSLLILTLAVWFVCFNLRPTPRRPSGRLRVLIGGYELFLTALLLFLCELPCFLYLLRLDLPLPLLLGDGAAALLTLCVLVVNGFFRMVFASAQMGIVLRVLLLTLWWCPVVNLILLWRACRAAKSEYRFELAKLELDDLRRENEICKTKYPILLVHGIFFRDWQLVNYWGRIPKVLVRNGAEIYYGGQQSAAAVADSAAELKARMLQVLRETGSEKLNIIAHSKGGLDARYAISRLGMAPYVASLTTINTPHRGCIFAQELLRTLPAPAIHYIANKYQKLFQKLGDTQPDFLAGVTDLTAQRCEVFNRETPDAEGVLYQSVMSTMKKASSAGPPLNVTYLLVKHYDKEANDGLVTLSSAQWGQYLGNQAAPGVRGISHGDIIDLMRENISGFDVREFYVSLVKGLRDRGL